MEILLFIHFLFLIFYVNFQILFMLKMFRIMISTTERSYQKIRIMITYNFSKKRINIKHTLHIFFFMFCIKFILISIFCCKSFKIISVIFIYHLVSVDIISFFSSLLKLFYFHITLFFSFLLFPFHFIS